MSLHFYYKFYSYGLMLSKLTKLFQVILKEFDPNMEDFEKEELEITEEINGAMGSFDSKKRL